MEVGTLKELNVKPGDVVRAVAWHNGSLMGEWYDGIDWVIYDRHPKGYYEGICAVFKEKGGGYTKDNEGVKFRIVSRATETPKLWRDMTPEEKGALLLAHHEGKAIEMLFCSGEWVTVTPQWATNAAYRIRPEPKRETHAVRLVNDKTGEVLSCGMITLIDGKPDLASIKMEEL